MTLKQYKYLPSIPCVPLNWYNFPFLELRQRVHRKGKLYRILHAAAALNDCSINIRNNDLCRKWLSYSFPSFSLAPEVAFPFVSVYFVSSAQLSFSYLHCLPVEMFPHPRSLERKLDLKEKRDIHAYNKWKRRPLKKIWLWNGLTFRDASSACELSIIDWHAGSSNPPK